MPTIIGKNYCHVPQALAPDEYRENFQPRPYLIGASYDYAEVGQSIKQHCLLSRQSAFDLARGTVHRVGHVLTNGLTFPADTTWRKSRLLQPVHANSRRRDVSV